MPRTTTLQCPGCPPLRALTFDAIGLVKVIEARSKQSGVAKVVDRWGEPDSYRAVLAASIDENNSKPLLAVARKNRLVEISSPVNGELYCSVSNSDDSTISSAGDPIAGLHLFKKKIPDSPSSSCTLLSCTMEGKITLRTVELETGSVSSGSKDAWVVSGSGEVYCSMVHEDEVYSVFGGKGVELHMWDLEKPCKIWNSKSPPRNSLGIFTPTWFTSVSFMNKDDHRKIVAGTNAHQVRLYDISAQRRPVLSVDFRETPIKAVVEDLDGNTIYFGNGAGDLASIDIRTGKVLGCFVGKCSGSIRSIARHPEHSVIASCGLDSYLRVWDVKSRQLLSAVYLKQHLMKVVFDSSFSDEETTTTEQPPGDAHGMEGQESENAHDTLPVKRKKAPKDSSEAKKKKKSKKKTTKEKFEDSDDY